MMPLTMTEEMEARIRSYARYPAGSYLQPHTDTCALLIELDAARAELARLRAEMPSEGERRDLEALREVRADEFAASSAASIRSMCRGEVALRVLPGSYGQAWWLTLAALLAPEGEVSRG